MACDDASGEPDVPTGDAGEGGLTDPSTGGGDEDQAESGTSGMCSVTFDVTTPGAVIVVYGVEESYLLKSGVPQDLPSGTYTYIITADGYEPDSYTFTISSENSLIFPEITLEPGVDSPVRFTEDTMSVYTKSFILPYVVPDEVDPSFEFTSGVEFDETTNTVTLQGNELTVTVKMTAEYQEVIYSDYLTILVIIPDGVTIDSDIMISYTEAARDEAVSREDQVKYIDIETTYNVYLDISSASGSNVPKTIDITEILKQLSHVDGMEFGYGHDEYEVLAAHFGDHSVDYPEVKIIDGQVYVTVSEFSTYGFYIYLAQEHTAFDPVNPPWFEDDDYVPLPPVIVDETEDNSVEVMACAAAAVVAALMAAFLIIDRRKG